MLRRHGIPCSLLQIIRAPAQFAKVGPVEVSLVPSSFITPHSMIPPSSASYGPGSVVVLMTWEGGWECARLMVAIALPT